MRESPEGRARGATGAVEAEDAIMIPVILAPQGRILCDRHHLAVVKPSSCTTFVVLNKRVALDNLAAASSIQLEESNAL
jgi:hypothetical protein